MISWCNTPVSAMHHQFSTVCRNYIYMLGKMFFTTSTCNKVFRRVLFQLGLLSWLQPYGKEVCTYVRSIHYLLMCNKSPHVPPLSTTCPGVTCLTYMCVERSLEVFFFIRNKGFRAFTLST